MDLLLECGRTAKLWGRNTKKGEDNGNNKADCRESY